MRSYLIGRGNKICPTNRTTNERTNAADGQPENILTSPTLSVGKGIKKLIKEEEK